MNSSFEICRLAARFANKELKIRNAHLKQVNLTTEQSYTLQYIYEHPGASIKELAAYLGVTHQVSCGITDRLKKKDLIEIQVSSKDGRVRLLQITEQGEKLYHWIHENGENTGKRITAGMSIEEQEEFVRLLNKAISSLEEGESH